MPSGIDWSALISGLVGTLVLGIPQFFLLRTIARKTKAEALSGEASAVKTFAEGADLTGKRNITLQKEMNEMEEKMEKRISHLEKWVEALQKQVIALGGTPVVVED